MKSSQKSVTSTSGFIVQLRSSGSASSGLRVVTSPCLRSDTAVVGLIRLHTGLLRLRFRLAIAQPLLISVRTDALRRTDPVRLRGLTLALQSVKHRAAYPAMGAPFCNRKTWAVHFSLRVLGHSWLFVKSSVRSSAPGKQARRSDIF